jgi:hypothetical protein
MKMITGAILCHAAVNALLAGPKFESLGVLGLVAGLGLIAWGLADGGSSRGGPPPTRE